MTHLDFLTAFAELNNIGTLADLLELHSQKYASQINSRENATKTIVSLEQILGLSWEGQRVLDWGCTYGACAIEIAKLGALSVGCDVSSKWLELAKINAKNEANPVFLNCDASLSSSRQLLAEFGVYNLVLADKILDRIYDSVGALKNMRTLMTSDGIFYFKLTNGRATRNILKEKYKQVFGLSILAPDYWPLFVKAPFLIYYRRWDHWLSLFNELKFCDLKVFNNGNNESIDVTRKHILADRVFGISLLPPDYWSSFVDVPFHIYYRRWEYFTAQFNQFGFHDLKVLNSNTDPSLESTQKHINADIKKIRKHLKPENFKSATQFQLVRKSCGQYFDEVNEDLQNMAWEQLYFKYRVTFWEGLILAP